MLANFTQIEMNKILLRRALTYNVEMVFCWRPRAKTKATTKMTDLHIMCTRRRRTQSFVSSFMNSFVLVYMTIFLFLIGLQCVLPFNDFTTVALAHHIKFSFENHSTASSTSTNTMELFAWDYDNCWVLWSWSTKATKKRKKNQHKIDGWLLSCQVTAKWAEIKAKHDFPRQSIERTLCFATHFDLSSQHSSESRLSRSAKNGETQCTRCTTRRTQMSWKRSAEHTRHEWPV